MAYFVNTDIKPKVGGRKAALYTQQELLTMLIEQAKTVSKKHNGYLNPILQAVQNPVLDEDNLMTHVVRALVNLDTTLQKDNKFKASTENVMCLARMGGLMGFHTLPNGLTFYGFYMGGDGEHPMFMVLYHDSKRIRLYTPTCGNTINLDCKCAFGVEEYADGFDMDKLEKKYKQLGVWIPEEDCDDLEYPLVYMYIAKYGIDTDWYFDDGLDYAWEYIQTDIESRIELVQRR